jgi:predicted membrane metal-binding protein
MLWAAVAHSCGIIAGVYLWRPTSWWFIAGAAFVCAAAYFARRGSPVGWTLALGTFFLLGALNVQMRGSAPRLDTSIQPYADGQELQVTAHVTHDGRLQPGGFAETRQTVEVETEQITTATGDTLPIHSGVRLSIYTPRSNDESDEGSPLTHAAIPVASHYGQRLHFSTKLKRPRNFRNPGAFDYEGYLADRASPPCVQPKVKASNCSPGLPAVGFTRGAAACIAASSQRCTRSGPRAKPR